MARRSGFGPGSLLVDVGSFFGESQQGSEKRFTHMHSLSWVTKSAIFLVNPSPTGISGWGVGWIVGVFSAALENVKRWEGFTGSRVPRA